MQRYQITETPLTSEEISTRMSQMIQERQRQAEEFRRNHGISTAPRPPLFQIERPLTSEEINTRMFAMMQERQRQEAEFRRHYAGPQGFQSEQTGLQAYQAGSVGPQGFQSEQTGPQGFQSGR